MVYNLTILVPYLNEADQLESFCRHLIERLSSSQLKIQVVLVTLGSEDGSEQIVDRLAGRPHWAHLKYCHSSRSVGKTLKKGISHCQGEWIWILPVDMRVPMETWSAMEGLVVKGDIDSAAFFKNYSPETAVMRAYRELQNHVRLKVLKNWVWTNGVLLRRQLAQDVPTVGFMEDVIWSDQLKQVCELTVVPSPVMVSARRYRSVLYRIALNLSILLRFRLLRTPVSRLKVSYLGGAR